MQLTTKSFCYMFNLCNIKYYFWLNNIGTSIVSCQEVHVFNTRIAFICGPDQNKMFITIISCRRTYKACEYSDDWAMSSLCAQWIEKDLSFLHADCKDLSDWVDNQADLSLRQVHKSIVSFVKLRLKYSRITII